MYYELFDGTGLEMIDFQYPDLFTGLTTVIGRLRVALDAKDIKAEFAIAKDIDEVVRKRTGLPVETVIEQGKGEVSIAIMPRAKTHPFNKGRIDDVHKAFSVDLILAKSPFSGTVNLKKSTVGGDFAKDTPSRVYIDTTMFALLTDEEIAATYIHELGHLFFYYTFLAIGAVTNAVLSEVTQLYQGTPTKEQKITLLKKVERAVEGRFANIDEMAASEPGTVVAVVNAMCIDTVRREMGTRFYDSRLEEAMADAFVARHGAGKVLVRALEKLHKADQYSPHHQSTAKTLILHATKLVIGVGFVALLYSGVVAAVYLAARIAFITTIGYWITSSYGYDDTYDDLPHRYKAIRNEMIASLKRRNLSKEDTQIIIDDIAEIDAVIKKLSAGISGSFMELGSFIHSYLSGRHHEFKFNRQLEALANNNLFLAAAKLSV